MFILTTNPVIQQQAEDYERIVVTPLRASNHRVEYAHSYDFYALLDLIKSGVVDRVIVRFPTPVRSTHEVDLTLFLLALKYNIDLHVIGGNPELIPGDPIVVDELKIKIYSDFINYKIRVLFCDPRECEL